MLLVVAERTVAALEGKMLERLDSMAKSRYLDPNNFMHIANS